MRRVFFAVASFAVLICCFCNTAFGFMPTPGFWYNPAESGRGFNIDYQNNVMAVASYVYDSSGKPIWYTSAGTYDDKANIFTATFDSTTSGGQCLGCIYTGKPPVNVGAGGAITIVFDSIEHGTLYFPGGSTPIQHLTYAYSGADPKTNLYGEWLLSFSSTFGISFSDWVIFNTTYTASDGTTYVAGYVDGDSTKVALGGWTSSVKYLIVVSQGSSSTLYDTYNFTAFDVMRGIGNAYIQSSAGLGSPYAGVGFRLLTAHQVGAGGKSLAGLHGASEQYEQLAAAHRAFAH